VCVVDPAFVKNTEFRALAPAFRLIFGTANEPQHAPPPQAGAIIGHGMALCASCAKLHRARKTLAIIEGNGAAGANVLEQSLFYELLERFAMVRGPSSGI
jgi:hypothetical protein